MFVLCYRCALENVQDTCSHKCPKERGLFGIWTHVDLDEALKNGGSCFSSGKNDNFDFVIKDGIYIRYSCCTLGIRIRRERIFLNHLSGLVDYENDKKGAYFYASFYVLGFDKN